MEQASKRQRSDGLVEYIKGIERIIQSVFAQSKYSDQDTTELDNDSTRFDKSVSIKGHTITLRETSPRDTIRALLLAIRSYEVADRDYVKRKRDVSVIKMEGLSVRSVICAVLLLPYTNIKFVIGDNLEFGSGPYLEKLKRAESFIYLFDLTFFSDEYARQSQPGADPNSGFQIFYSLSSSATTPEPNFDEDIYKSVQIDLIEALEKYISKKKAEVKWFAQEKLDLRAKVSYLIFESQREMVDYFARSFSYTPEGINRDLYCVGANTLMIYDRSPSTAFELTHRLNQYAKQDNCDKKFSTLCLEKVSVTTAIACLLNLTQIEENSIEYLSLVNVDVMVLRAVAVLLPSTNVKCMSLHTVPCEALPYLEYLSRSGIKITSTSEGLPLSEHRIRRGQLNDAEALLRQLRKDFVDLMDQDIDREIRLEMKVPPVLQLDRVEDELGDEDSQSLSF